MPTTHRHKINITMKKIIQSAVLAVILGLPAITFGQVPGVIGVKFGFTAASGYASSTVLAPTDAAGILVDGVLAVSNWNNLLTGNTPSLSAEINTNWIVAQDSAGNALSGVTLTPAGWNDGWESGGTDCANGRLLYTFWKLNLSDGNAGVGTVGGNTYATFTFSNLTATKYDVYVYVNDNNGNYWGNVEANAVVAIGSFTANGFNGAENDPCGLSTQLHTATGYGNDANYVEMPAVATTAGGVITISVVDHGGNDFAIPGIELVPTGTVIETGPPLDAAPAVSPSYASLGVVAGTAATLTASASGQPTISYHWQTDGASGNTPTNIPGATSSNLAVNTTGWLPGTYVYDYVAQNSLGTNTSSTVDIIVTAPSLTPAISVQFEGDGNSSVLHSAEVAGYIPHAFWNVDDNITAFTSTNLVDNTDAPTVATVKVTYGNGQYHSSDNTTTPDDILMSGGFWAGSGYTVNVTGVPYPSYNVYLYMLNDDNPNRRYGFTLGSQTYWGSVFDGNGYSVPPYTLDTQTTELAEGTQMQANVVQFTDVTGSSFTITGQTPDGNVALMGMEIVNPAGGPAIATPINISPGQGTIYEGLPVVLSEYPFGAAPVTYQWITDGGSGGTLTNIAGATNSSLDINTSGFAPGNYNYQVVVANSTDSSTSAVVTLTITTSAPILVTDISPAPANEGYVGQTITYSPVFAGTLPITYQWMVDTGSGPTNIPGATNSTLILNNLQFANAGTYSLTANNIVGGPVSSSSSALTVLADPASVGSTAYGTSVLAYQPFAYWPIDDTDDPSTGVAPVYDASGHGFYGVFGLSSQNGFDGVVGPQPPAFPGFDTNSWASESINGETNAWITVPPLNLTSNSVTISMWIYPLANELTFTGLLMNRPYGAGLGFGGSTSNGTAELGYTWNNNAGNTWGFNSGLYPLLYQWSFVALVVQPTQATLYLYYIDPNTGLPDLYSTNNVIPHETAPFNTMSLIGTDPDSPAELDTREFTGSIDEVAVFNTALSGGQLLQIFSEGAGLGYTAVTIAGQPQSVTEFVGGTATFTASGILGSIPLSYQWQQNGTNITGATNTTLTIDNITSANAGSYQLFVTNPVGPVGSSVATLTVVSPVANSYDAAVLADNPLAYWKLNETSNPANGGVVAYEYVNGNNGVYQTAAQNGFNGVVGPESPAFPGFPTINTALQTFGYTPDCYVAASAGDLVAGNLTYVMWINPSDIVTNFAGLLMDRGGAGEGLGFGGDTNAIGMADLGYTWNQNNQNTWGFGTFLFPPINQWSLVAVTISPSQATVYMINSNGVQSAVNAIEHDSEEFGVAWHIGNDAGDGGNGSRTFPGSISDVSVYLSTLSSDQLASLYTTGAGRFQQQSVTLSVAPGTEGNVILTWSKGTLLQAPDVTGPWVTNNAATSPYSVPTTSSQMFFRAVLVQ
jgi:hypothetical protein